MNPTSVSAASHHRRAARKEPSRPLADLAEIVLSIAREITLRADRDNKLLRLAATEINILRFVTFHPGSMPKEVAETLDLKRSNFSVALRNLRSRGLLRVEPDPQDRRSMQLYVTEKAEKNLEQHRAFWERLLKANVKEDLDIAGCVEVLGRVERSLRPR